jgi:hypothetical protein
MPCIPDMPDIPATAALPVATMMAKESVLIMLYFIYFS